MCRDTMGEVDFLRGTLAAVVVGGDEGRGVGVRRGRVLLNARWRGSHALKLPSQQITRPLALGPSSAPARLEDCLYVRFSLFLHVLSTLKSSKYFLHGISHSRMHL